MCQSEGILEFGKFTCSQESLLHLFKESFQAMVLNVQLQWASSGLSYTIFTSSSLKTFYLSVEKLKLLRSHRRRLLYVHIFVPSGTMGDHLRAMKCFMRPNGIQNQIQCCTCLNNNTALLKICLLHSWLHPPNAINVPSNFSCGHSNVPS